MKKIILMVMMACVVPAAAQNWTAVSAINITDLNQQKLAAGQLCFLGTDQNDVPVSFNVGGGGQVLKRPFCTPVANGAVSSFTVPNPVNTAPAGIYYRVTVKDVNTGQEVLRYTQVSFTGATFSFDNYAPLTIGQFAPPSGNAVNGNLSVSGNMSITGSLAAGSFTPTAITSGQFTSNTVNPAGSGIVRLATGDCMKFRNNANTADVNGICKNASDQVTVGNGPWVVPAVSDQSVGRATTDTLSNKTLTGAVSGNSVTLLNEQGPTSILTGNSTDQAIYTYTLPANTIAAGKGIRITIYAEHDAGTATISWKLNFGGTAWTTVPISDTTPPAKAERFECIIFNNAGVTNAQHGSAWVIMGTGAVAQSGSSTAAVAATSNVTITFTFNVASTDQARGMQFLVELIQ